METEQNGLPDDWIRVVRENLSWWLLGLILLAVIVNLFTHFIGWIVLGLYFYYTARPINRRLERWFSPSLAAASTLLLIVIPFVLIFAVVLLIAAAGLEMLLMESVNPTVIQSLLDALPIVEKDLPGHQISVEYVFRSALAVIRSAARSGVYLLLTGLFAFVLLFSDRRISRWFRTEMLNNDSEERSPASSRVKSGGSDAVGYLMTVDRGIKSIYFGYRSRSS